MVSECGPMCPVGYGMNQGQGQETRGFHGTSSVFGFAQFWVTTHLDIYSNTVHF